MFLQKGGSISKLREVSVTLGFLDFQYMNLNYYIMISKYFVLEPNYFKFVLIISFFYVLSSDHCWYSIFSITLKCSLTISVKQHTGHNYVVYFSCKKKTFIEYHGTFDDACTKHLECSAVIFILKNKQEKGH